MIGPLIRYLRILAGLSHYDLARMSNATVSQTHVAEADRSNDPELILALLYALGIDPDPAVIDTVCALADRDDPRYLGWMPATLDLATVHGPLRDIETVEHTLGEPIISENARPPGLIIVTDPLWWWNRQRWAHEMAHHLAQTHGPAYQAIVGRRVSYLFDPSLIRLISWHPRSASLTFVGPAHTPMTVLGPHSRRPCRAVGWPVHVRPPRPAHLEQMRPVGGVWVPPDLADLVLPGSDRHHRYRSTECVRTSLLLGTV